MIVEQVDTGSDSCEDGICFTSFSPSPSNQTYRIGVSATNILGSSNSTKATNLICKSKPLCFSSRSLLSLSIDGSVEPIFSHVLTSEDCVTTVRCSTTLSEIGNCTVQYGQDPSIKNFSLSIRRALNSPTTLPLEPNTVYYYLATVTINSSLTFQITGEYDNRQRKVYDLQALVLSG